MRSVSCFLKCPSLVMHSLRRSCRLSKIYRITLLAIFAVVLYYAISVKLWNANFLFHMWPGPESTPNFPTIAIEQLEILLTQNVQHVCTIAQQVGKHPAFTLCKESTSGRLAIEDTAVVSVETWKYDFELELLEEYKNISIYMFGSRLNTLSSKKNIIYNESWLYYLTWLPYIGRHVFYILLKRLMVAVPKPHTIFKIGNFNENNLNPWLLDRLLEDQVLQAFSQLQIQVKIDHKDDSIIEEWVTTFTKLSKNGYKLFRSRTLDDCFIKYVEVEPCLVATSWLKPPQLSVSTIFGEINPLDLSGNIEEKITRVLTWPTIHCSKKVKIPISPIIPDDRTDFAFLSTDHWPVCMENIQQPCIVYSAKLGGTETFENSLAQLGCAVFLFDPTLKISQERRGPRNDIHAYSWGLGTVNANIVSGLNNGYNTMLKYMTASNITAALHHEKFKIDVLRLDLHGGEWDIIEHLIARELIKNFNQIVVTMHVWHGEEVFILFDRFMRLKKLLKEGFEIYYSDPLKDITLDLKEQTCCYVVGWLRKLK